MAELICGVYHNKNKWKLVGTRGK